ncbi:glycosyltransferase [Helicobacter ailurogastricus]|uniref:glycosyltransferase n=1 Tax=Helicobacter ailurogastricus TaxID=1578720 RepID=UPI0024928564|nr:glycosyltransferase [Helicobacter ailurogastricus]
MHSSITIPVVVFFNMDYYIPAGVAMHSMLAHVARTKGDIPLFYKIHALVQGLDKSHMDKLQENIASFTNFASLEICNLDLNNETSIAQLYHEKLRPLISYLHPNRLAKWSELILLRFILPSLFPQYDKIISCDVDVVFTGDISESYLGFNLNDSYYFVAAKSYYIGSLQGFIEGRRKAALSYGIDVQQHFLSDNEHRMIYENKFNVGFMVVNLQAWRRDDFETKALDFFKHKNHALLCPEQDALILLCHGHILELSRKYNTEHGLISPEIKDRKEIIMWHFIWKKPWKLENFCTSKIWINALLHTPLRFEYFNNLIQCGKNLHLSLYVYD